ncbi:hypothetical protein NDU88_006978 [Pleurodeles waltl]|uniref:Uncharacterized protein n=1 Tax=Pleurodeles waltl TaxID=8319 RepID=A0AAV7SR27_PLEWA|nr:hypothetical protein NDU88_006978 [Pleurodeles waltl]
MAFTRLCHPSRDEPHVCRRVILQKDGTSQASPVGDYIKSTVEIWGIVPFQINTRRVKHTAAYKRMCIVGAPEKTAVKKKRVSQMVNIEFKEQGHTIAYQRVCRM